MHMAMLIGIVSKVIGQVFAVASDGTRRALIEGDRLFASDQLVTGAEGAVAVHLQNGQELTLGRDSNLQMNSQLLAHQTPHVVASEAVTPSEAQLTDVQQLQKAIAAGADPTQTGEATAAGPDAPGAPGGALGGGHSFVMLEEVGGHIDPAIGFPTAGFGGIPELPEERHNADINGNTPAAGVVPDAVPSVVPAVVPAVVPGVVPPVVVNHPVTLGGLGGELTLNEANLPDGSASNPSALTQSGTFTVAAPDGLLTLNIGGISVMSGGVAAGFPHSITTQLGNTLTVTGYNPATGMVSYSYTLNVNETHSAGDGTNNLIEQFSVVAGDRNGDTATGSLDINITDDVPKAVDDGNAITATPTALTLEGNVLTNDVQGADRVPTGPDAGPITAGTFTGTYGTLVLNANGTYTYTLNTSSADFNALHDGGSGTEKFTYTLTDSDGDTSTATLQLNIHNSPVTLNGLDVQGGELTVYEKNLTYGSEPNAPALTQTGTFTVSAPDGLQTLTVGGVAVISGGMAAGFPQSAATDHGATFTVTGYNPATGVVSYSYTLNNSDTHPNANGANSISENIHVVATDADGSTAHGQINVNIVDDVPKAVDDGNAITATPTALTLEGNVLTNDVQGADRVPTGPDSGPITAGTFTGTYGTLVLNANGTYTYTLNTSSADFNTLHDGGSGTEKFTYTLTDADGDTSTATLQLNIHNSPVTLNGLDVQGGELTVYEKNLTSGSEPNAPALTQTGTFTVSAPDGLQTLTVGGVAVISGGMAAGFPQSAATDHGATFTVTGYNPVTGVVSYSYTLNYSDTHPTGNGANSISENIHVVATDADGSTAHGQINVNIVDDVPTAHADATSVSEGGIVTGNVLWNDVGGADGLEAGGGVVGVRAGADTSTPVTDGLNSQINGTYGYLTLDAHGYAEYHSNPNAVSGPGASDTFTYTLRDADGDESTTTVTIDVNNSFLATGSNVVPNSPPVAVADHVITNVLSGTVVVPGELLLTNDTDVNGDPLTATPTTFNTGWVAKGADFTGTGVLPFAGRGNIADNQVQADVRNLFAANTAAMTAVLVVSGYLGAVNHATANDEDLITVNLKQGETLNLNHDLGAGQINMEYSLNGGAFVTIPDGGTITAQADGTYQIHLTNITDPSGNDAKGAEDYQLTMTVNYAGAHDLAPDAHGTYTANDNHGGSDTANVTISYQDGHTLTGTSGDDILVAGAGNNIINAGDGNDVLTAGSGNNELHGGAGNDLLFSGPGNDLLDGGTGIDTASYAHATAGVTVDLSLLTAQNTLGAGTDTLTGIENLTGSNFNDTLTGDNNNNIIDGGLGNDILKGGGGDDLLIGGLGDNTLTGGSGADTFQWRQGNSGHDVVTDFTPGTDKLDLSQLLQGENNTAASLDDYLHFKVTGSGATLVTSIDVSSMAGAAPNQTIDLAGVNLASHYGVTPGAGGVIAGGHDTATIITGMLNDHSLKVDTV
jgi:VCBS repeat-containing protein